MSVQTIQPRHCSDAACTWRKGDDLTCDTAPLCSYVIPLEETSPEWLATYRKGATS